MKSNTFLLMLASILSICRDSAHFEIVESAAPAFGGALHDDVDVARRSPGVPGDGPQQRHHARRDRELDAAFARPLCPPPMTTTSYLEFPTGEPARRPSSTGSP